MLPESQYPANDGLLLLLCFNPEVEKVITEPPSCTPLVGVILFNVPIDSYLYSVNVGETLAHVSADPSHAVFTSTATVPRIPSGVIH